MKIKSFRPPSLKLIFLKLILHCSYFVKLNFTTANLKETLQFVQNKILLFEFISILKFLASIHKASRGWHKSKQIEKKRDLTLSLVAPSSKSLNFHSALRPSCAKKKSLHSKSCDSSRQRRRLREASERTTQLNHKDAMAQPP